MSQQQEYTQEEIIGQLLVLEELGKEIMNRLVSRLDKDISEDKAFWKSINERYIRNEKGLFIHPIPKMIYDSFAKKSKWNKLKALLTMLTKWRRGETTK